MRRCIACCTARLKKGEYLLQLLDVVRLRFEFISLELDLPPLPTREPSPNKADCRNCNFFVENKLPQHRNRTGGVISDEYTLTII